MTADYFLLGLGFGFLAGVVWAMLVQRYPQAVPRLVTILFALIAVLLVVTGYLRVH
jgi:hypothetical protein